jgi:hypothetical protein
MWLNGEQVVPACEGGGEFASRPLAGGHARLVGQDGGGERAVEREAVG